MNDTRDYRILRVDQLTDEMVQRWHEQGIVFLVGSYVSTLHPTALPSGMTIGRELYKLLFDEGFPGWLKEDFNDIPFEALMQCYPKREKIQGIISQMCRSDVANPVHQALASSLVMKEIDGIITTNYDWAFESCWAASSGVCTVFNLRSFKEYCDLQEQFGPDCRVCFKIHGTARPGFESTIACDLEAEGWLLPWKRKLLQNMLRGRVLVLVGYSGRDFDICPELAESTGQSETVWLQLPSDTPTENSARVLRRRHGCRLEGYLIECIERILGRKIPICATVPQLPWNPQAFFEPSLLNEWRLRILDWLACPNLGMNAFFDAKLTQIEARRFRASMFGHIGRYRDVVTELEAIATSPELTDDERLRFETDIAVRRFIYGQHLRAWKMLGRIENRVSRGTYSKDTEALVCESRMMMYMRVAQACRRIGLTTLLAKIREKSAPHYEKARHILEREGAWGRLEALQHNAERIGIARPAGLPLPAREGYRSLGLMSMHVITERDQIRSKTGKLSRLDFATAKKCLVKAERYGWNHETWKFHWILFRRGRLHRARHFRRFWTYYWRTQYPWLARLLQLFLN